MSAPSVAELERRLEESEQERKSLLEALQDTLQLQRMAEEAGATREPTELLKSFALALGRICPWTTAEVRVRSGPTDRKLTNRAFQSGMDPAIEAEIRELDEEGLLGWALEADRPSVVPSQSDPSDPGWIVIPLLVQGEDVGFALLRPSSRESPSPRQLEMLRLVATQTSIALDNLAHIDEIRQGYAELRSLHQVASSLGRTLDPQRLFDTVLDALRERMEARVVALGLIPSHGAGMRTLADGAAPEDCADLLGRIANAGTGLRLDVALSSGLDLGKFGCRRALGLPLIHGGGTCLGALLVAESDGSALEADDATAWLESVANLLAAAVDNAGLYQEVVSANQKMSELQSRMIQAGRLEGIGQLAGGIAHEINNPLQVILGRVQIVQARSGGSPELMADLGRIESETMRIAHIVRSLQDFSRQDSGDKQGRPIRFSQLAESVLDLVGHRIRRQGITVERVGFDTSPLVSGDLDQLRQVVLNLCINAVQAMPEGGVLTVETHQVDGRSVLEVSDTGPGISPEDLARIFDPFFTRGTGMGLGLAIGYAVAQRHDGTLEVAPVPGQGAKFRLVLPCYRPPIPG